MENKEIGKQAHWRFRGLKITLAVIASVWAVFLLAVQILMSSSFLTGIAKKYVSEYVDADVYFGNISASVLKSFPNLNIEVSDVKVTYPHSRFASYDSTGVDGLLRHAGRGESVDTLASFKRLNLSVNYLAAVMGRIHVHEASLDRPRIFAHCFGYKIANWNILKNISLDENDVPDTSTTVLPPIAISRVALTGHPHIVYTDCADTIYAAMFLKQMLFHGRLTTRKAKRNKLGLEMDSLFLSGRLPADTVVLAVDHFGISEKEKDMAFSVNAKTFLGMNDYGRLLIPVSLSGKLNFPNNDFKTLALKDFRADVATVTLTGNADAKFLGDSTYLRAEASINDCNVQNLIHFCGKNFLPSALKLDTDAVVSLTALCDGYYNPSAKTLPELVAEIVLPKSYIRYPGIPDGHAEIDINAVTDKEGKLDVSFDDMCVNFGGFDVDAKGMVKDVLGDDPLIIVDSKGYASLGQLMAFAPDTCGYSASGEINAALKGNIRMSQMSPYNFYGASLDGYIRSRNVVLSSDSDSLYAWIGNPEIKLGTVSNRVDGALPRGTRLLALTARIDTLYANYGKGILFRGSGVGFVAQNAYKTYRGAAHEHNPIVGALSFSRLFMNGEDSLFMGVVGSENTFRYSEKCHGRIHTPMLSLVSSNSKIFARQGVNRYGFRDAELSASAVLTTFERSQRRRVILDSLQRVYPGVPRDSLFKRAIESKMVGRQLPDFMSEADFRKHDINITLNETLAKYLKEWNLKGGIDIKSGIVLTPYFPLRNVVEDVRGTLTNDAVNLDNFTFRPGTSDMSASGVLSGLKGALLGYGPLKLDLKLRSKKMDANELLTAYNVGAKYVPDESSEKTFMSDVSEASYFDSTTVAENIVADSTLAMIVIPANLIANVSLQANEIDYSDLKISWLAADMTMKERCLQLTNTLATSNMGDIYFEGFYSTRTKHDIKAGFDLNLSDITADKVVQLFPAVDTIMPMLTSFKGMLDCEMAATTDLDTNMNVIGKSMNGIMKISGRNVSLEESTAFHKLAKMLMFKNKKTGKVGDMSVSGLISDNRLEIFPFVLKVDRYTLAMSGLQNFDQTFKYHVAVLKSPVPFRFGINIFGNFDDWKYRIGKAQYKNTNVPVFTAQIDTLQMNLVSSIHNIFAKGVDLAVRQNVAMKNSIDSCKIAKGFNPDASIDSLDAGQMKVLDSLQTAYDSPVDSMLNARIDSLKIVSSTSEVDVQSGIQSSVEKQFRQKENAENKRDCRRRRRDAKRSGKQVGIVEFDDDIYKD